MIPPRNYIFIILTCISFFFFPTQKSFCLQSPTVHICQNDCTIYDGQDCYDVYIEYIQNQYGRFIVKQIKDSNPDEQFLLVLDAVACYMAEIAELPINRTKFIPAHIPHAGKKKPQLPATMHTLAQGISCEACLPWPDFDLHQRYRKENSQQYRKYGPLPISGLNEAVLQTMSRHAQLACIAAFDTFIGNADRSNPNIFYDLPTNSFCGIDCAAAFSTPLAQEALKNLPRLMKAHRGDSIIHALHLYADTLQQLCTLFPPERFEQLLNEYANTAGFIEGSDLYNQDIQDRLKYHVHMFTQNYAVCRQIVTLLKTL